MVDPKFDAEIKKQRDFIELQKALSDMKTFTGSMETNIEDSDTITLADVSHQIDNLTNLVKLIGQAVLEKKIDE